MAITLLAGLQTVSPSLYEGATIDGASRSQLFRHITYPLLTPIIAVVMTFSALFTFTDFQLIWAITRGGPANATHLMATLSYQRAILGGHPGEGADFDRHDSVPAGGHPDLVVRTAAAQVAAGRGQ